MVQKIMAVVRVYRSWFRMLGRGMGKPEELLLSPFRRVGRFHTENVPTVRWRKQHDVRVW